MAQVLTRNFRDAVLKITDGDSNEIILELETGDLSWAETRNRINVLDRGVLSHVRDGDEVPVTLSFSGHYAFTRSDSADADEAISAHEAMTKTGQASNWATAGGAGEPYAFKLEFWLLNPATAGKDEKIVFAKCRLTSFVANEGDEANTMSFESEDFETAPTITREDYS